MKLRSATTPRPAALVLAVLLASCAHDSDGRRPPPGGEVTSTVLTRFESAPGVVVRVLSVRGGSGSGFHRPGDPITVRFRLEKDDGSSWRLDEMVEGRALVSGPTFNYQRVLPEQDDVVERGWRNLDGSYSYTFAPRLPATYLAPFNDSVFYGATDGELTGTNLLSGTYTVALAFAWDYTVEGRVFRDGGDAAGDFLVGGGTPLAPRQVVGQENCNRCHVELRAHDDLWRTVTTCLMCHTSGAEDLNDANVGNGTRRVLIDSRNLFHKIHNASRLPSVVGVGVQTSGQLDYTVAPRRLRYATSKGTLREFTDVDFPAWPNRTQPMPRDVGHAALPVADQALEDRVRTGITSCFLCHGDPDGAGPLGAPAQGDLILSQPSRRACDGCHDDVDYTRLYEVNFQQMPPQPDDSNCVTCHEPSGGPLAIETGHLHPLRDPLFQPGLNLELLDVAESGNHDGDGTFDPGEKVRVVLQGVTDAGVVVPKSQIDVVEVVLSGPTSNAQLLYARSIPKALLVNPPPFALDLPDEIGLEHVGDSSAASDVFATARRPHLDDPAAPTTVFARGAAGAGASTLAVDVPVHANFLDLADASGFDRDDVLVIDDGVPGREEYLRVRFVDGERVWFGSLAEQAGAQSTRFAHFTGATVLEVALVPLTEGVDYALDPVNGLITELAELGAGTAVIASYWTDFVVPGDHGPPLDDSPDLDRRHGEWTGLPLADGTYTLTLTGYRDRPLSMQGQANTYRVASPPATRELLFGNAAQLEPYRLIDSPEACQACHSDLSFHGDAYRGFSTCLACHGTAGAEDRPRYVAANAPATPGTSISLRSMLHRLHMGRLLSDPSAFRLVGAGPDPYPDNFAVRDFDTVLFPPQPGAAEQCRVCHGAANTAWQQPADRNHPAGQSPSVLAWTETCGACHDGAAAAAHITSQTSPQGDEACAVCHGPGKPDAVGVLHPAR